MSQDGVRNSASPKTKPSAIPWEMLEVSGSDVCPLARAEVFSSASVIWIAQVMELADAALIVKAVNLHDELVDRLQEAKNLLRDAHTVIRKLDPEREYFRILSIIEVVRERQQELLAKAGSQ